MTNDSSECGSGKFAGWTIPAEMLHTELRVSTSAQQDSLNPSPGLKLRVHSIFVSTSVTAALTSTLRGSVSFGTGNVTDSSKVLFSSRATKADDCKETFLPNLNVIGATNESITLTNVTFSAGSVIMRAVIYYTMII